MNNDAEAHKLVRAPQTRVTTCAKRKTSPGWSVPSENWLQVPLPQWRRPKPEVVGASTLWRTAPKAKNLPHTNPDTGIQRVQRFWLAGNGAIPFSFDAMCIFGSSIGSCPSHVLFWAAKFAQAQCCATRFCVFFLMSWMKR